MRLPNAHRAYVDPAKLTQYLLAGDHPTGQYKARFFTAMGFSRTTPHQLAAALRDIARFGTVTNQVATAFGDKYIVDGRLRSATGMTALVRTIWMVSPTGTPPRFVTAFPV